jgi:long-subunit fatty acid transport protein
MRITQKGIIGFIATVFIVFVAGALIGYYLVAWSFPKDTGTISVQGLVHEVNVYRGEYAVPHIVARSESDALRFSQFSSAVGARSQAMGNTIVGVADDYAALFGNPAGLAQQKSFEFTFGLSRLNYGNDVTFFSNKTADNRSALNLNNLGIVYPIATVRGGLTFAFGFGRVANFTSVATFDGFNPSSSIVRSFYPFSYEGGSRDTLYLYGLSNQGKNDVLRDNIPFNLYLADTSKDYFYTVLRNRVQQTARILEGGGLNHWSFGGAIDVAKDISFGLSLNFVTGSYSYDREYTEKDIGGVYSYYHSFDQWTFTNIINSDISGFNALFGFMYRKLNKYRIGFTVRIPTTYEITETFEDAGTSYFNDGGEPYSASILGKTKYKVTTPMVLSCGASVQANDWLLFAGDLEYTDWTQMEFDSNDPILMQENRNIKNWMQETLNLRGGTEVSIWDLGLKFRAGIEWKPSPWKDNPKEYDQTIYTAGIGVLIDENSSVNFSYALGDWKTFRDNYLWGNTPASRTSELITTQTVNITFSHRL